MGKFQQGAIKFVHKVTPYLIVGSTAVTLYLLI
jgi:hypothetical protein